MKINYQKYMRRKLAEQKKNQIPTLNLIIQIILIKNKQETKERRMPISQKILLNLKATKVKIIFQPQKMKSTTLKPHTKKIMEKIMKKIWKRILKKISKRISNRILKKMLRKLLKRGLKKTMK